MELDGTVNTVVYCDFLWVHGKSWPPVWKEHELVCEVERYQLETADFTSSQLGGSETRPWNGAGTCSNPGKQFGNWRGGRSVLLYLWLLRWRISGLMASGWPLLSADDLFLLAWSDDNVQLEWLTAQLEATQMKTSTSKSEAMVLCKKKKKSGRVPVDWRGVATPREGISQGLTSEKTDIDWCRAESENKSAGLPIDLHSIHVLWLRAHCSFTIPLHDD